ncbi:RDD family protein [Calidifontibacillus oryziterrae]|uniref:RDD family protein n=1 Tax=Calidifontibacillus oryziterrae TaxID=1191699 RepID=UPI0003130663|nr:RDD family protein [Calidifontibacillus oryziterrae]
MEEQTIGIINEQKSQQMDHKFVVFAGFWVRFWAFMIDLIVVGSLNRILIAPFLRWQNVPMDDSGLFSISAILTALIMYAYFIIMTKHFGQTLGKMIFGLRVVNETEEKLTWSTVVFRELVGKFISETVFFLGFIVAGFSARKKGWHDWIADTVVVQERRGLTLSHW